MNNNNTSLNKPKFANQMFPSILQKENKVKVCYFNLFDYVWGGRCADKLASNLKNV